NAARPIPALARSVPCPAAAPARTSPPQTRNDAHTSRIIPNRLVYPGLLVVALISPRGMGMGDVKLAGLIGLVLGSLGLSYVAVAAFAAVLAGGLGSVAVLVATGKARGQTIPLGPYLALGAVVAAFAAPQIAHAYMHLLGRA